MKMVWRRCLYMSTALWSTVLLASCGPNALLKDIEDKTNATQNQGTTIASQTVADPIFSPPTGTYQTNQQVTISESTPGAVIYYTSASGGATPPNPVSTAAEKYSGAPIQVSGNGTVICIKAMAAESGMYNSNVVTATVTINYNQVSTPQLSVSSGSYSGNKTLGITCPSPAGASIRYTTDGSTPTETTGTPYSAPITVSSTEKVTAIAYKSGFTDSTLAIATYTLPDSTPAFSPVGGTYASAQSVTLSTTMPGATIYYTTNGSTPTSSSTPYTSPIPVTTSQILKAVAGESGWTNSPVGTASYAIDQYYVYVANINGNTVSAFSINTSTGALTAVGSFNTGNGPMSVAVDPQYPFVYVLNYLDGTITAYEITASTGALTAVSGSPFASGVTNDLAIAPTGTYLYAIAGLSNPGKAYAYKINTSTGALTALSGNPYGTSESSSDNSMCVDSGGGYLYTVNQSLNHLTIYPLSSGTPGTSTIGSSAVYPSCCAAEPVNSGQYWVTDYNDAYIYLYNFSGTEQLACQAGTNPSGVAVDTTGRFVYVANHGSSNVSAIKYTYSSNSGSLVGNYAVGSGLNPQSVAVDPTGNFVYVATYNSGEGSSPNGVYAFKMNTSTGALTAVSGSPYTAGSSSGPHGIATAVVAASP
jgi:6-phosphogluconolactonase (cycloisomerase 2 family)